MNCYETLFVIKPTLTDEETTAQVDKIKDTLNKVGGELLATDDMGMRKLAYTVQKHDRGYYTVFYYKATGDAITEIERNLRINEEVIKFLTIKYTNNKELTQFNKLVESTNKSTQEA
jgi:small subunit ribosomal protein S6